MSHQVIRRHHLLVETIFLLLLPIASFGYPSFKALIPNGNQVPHPCDRTRFWLAVGHENPEGGRALNPFGKDLLKFNMTWTPALCRMDSDGDGVTNGQELGDPFCVWTSGAVPSVRTLADISHPGVCEPINSGTCIGKNLFLAIYCPSGVPITSTPGKTNFCQMPNTPANAYVVNSSPSRNGALFVAGDFIQYGCQRGYEISGVPTVYCQSDASWTFMPSCLMPTVIPKRIGVCPGLVTPDNGYVVRSSTLQANNLYAAGDTIEYACSVGYTLQGNVNMTTCLNNGTWTLPKPTCLDNRLLATSFDPSAVTCLAPPTPLNGYVANRQPLQIYPQYAFGDMVAYSCEPGYTISNRAALQCMSDGNWSIAVPTCQTIVAGYVLTCTCPRPIMTENAYISRSPYIDLIAEYTLGDVLQISCVQGFQVATRYSIVQCMGDGYWYPTTLPTCSRNVRRDLNATYCITPSPPEHGYILGGQSPAPNGDINYGLYSVGDEVRFSCIQGYRLVGDPLIRCQDDGSWLGRQLPTCNKAPLIDMSVMCDSPTLPANAVIQTQTRPYEGPKYIIGSFVMYGCLPGFGASGKPTVLCQKVGTWSATNFACTRLPPSPGPNVTCESPIPPLNAYIFASSPSPGNNRYAVGDFIRYACMDGFASDDRPITICQASGTFAPRVNMTCIRIARPPVDAITCLTPPIALDTHLRQISPSQVGNRYFVGEAIQFACNDGFSTSDTTILQCLQDGTWSAALPICVRNDRYQVATTPCISPRIPDNSFVMNNVPNRQYFAGDVIQYGCNDGYTVAGTSNRATCLNDGSWTQLLFVCQRNVRVAVTVTTCEPPVVPANGYVVVRSISLLGQRYSPNDYVQYACNADYSMVGSSTNVCNRDGSWSGAPTCIRISH